MYRSDDPLKDFERRDAEQQRWLDSLPTCTCCGEPIQQDDSVRIGTKWYCDECLEGMREGIGEW